MSATEHAFDMLAQVPTHYAREPVAPYGTRGVRRTFHCTHDFFARLEACFNELWAVAPLGQPEVLVSAGAHAEKPGEHGRGEAFDLDALFWPGRAFVTENMLRYPAFYLAIEAVLRRHF